MVSLKRKIFVEKWKCSFELLIFLKKTIKGQLDGLLIEHIQSIILAGQDII